MSIFSKNANLHIKDYLGVVQRKWKIILVSFLASLLGSIYINFTTTPVYLATTTLMINPDMAQTLLGSVNPYLSELNAQLSIGTELRVINSTPVAEGIVRRLNLADEDKDPDGFRVAVKKIQNSMTSSRVPKTRLFSISARAEDGKKASEIANIAAQVFIDQSLQVRLDASRRSIAWLADQIITMREKLEDSERSLLEYKRKEKVGTEGPAKRFQEQKISEIQGQFMESQNLEQELKTKINLVKNLLKQKEIRFIPTNLASSLNQLSGELTNAELVLKKAKLEYKAKHPKIIRLEEEIAIIQDQIRFQLGKTVAGLESEYQINHSRMKVLEASLSTFNKIVLASHEKEINVTILKRESETYKELYNVLIKKLKTMDITRGIGESNVRIIEEARVPSSPISPRRKKNLLFGLVVGFIVSLGMAFGLEYFDRTIHTPDDLEDSLDLPILVSIPRVKKKDKDIEGQFIFLTQSRQQSLEAMAFQTLRTSLRFSEADRSSQSYLVTSTTPSEGKTTITVNLGLSFAKSGHKTLIVDTDLRKPKIHSIFKNPNHQGLSNCSATTLDQSIQGTDFENLDLLTSGPHISNIFEFLESKEMQELIQRLKEDYEKIIFDSPPIGSVVDASILSTYVDGVIFVLRSGKIETIHVKHAKEQLEKVKANILGIVLNNLDYHFSKYYYSYYYHGDYYGDRAKEIFKGIKDSIQGM